MPSVPDITLEVKDYVDEILADWRDLLEDRPWLELPPDVDLDHLPELVEKVVEASVCGDGEEGPRRGVLRFALKHGQNRARLGFPDHVLFQEFHLLREAIWKGIRRRHPADRSAFGAIGRIDSTITAATRGSLHGYHEGDWDESLVEQLVGECSWPPAPSSDGGS